jgi:hypothetical protein
VLPITHGDNAAKDTEREPANPEQNSHYRVFLKSRKDPRKPDAAPENTDPDARRSDHPTRET